MKSISRRAGHAQEKLALDILSYEARAAFHQCYSLIWCQLIPLLAGLEKFDEPTWIFLKFWHTDWIDTETQTSLFHGHVFGLHPGMGPFMLSETGRRLVGTWVADPDEVAGLHRLLHGILIALFDYAGRRDQAAADRPRRAASEGPGSRP